MPAVVVEVHCRLVRERLFAQRMLGNTALADSQPTP
jgi:hypothetical protein